jgi:hypothetical protein
MATIEGKSSAEWFKDAAQRQKRSNAYAKYEEPAKAAPARQAAAMPKAENHASPAKAPEPKKDLDTLIRTTQEQITKARGTPEAPKKAEPAKAARPAPGQAKGNEHRWNADLNEAKQAGRVRSIVRRSEDEGRSSLHRLQSEARAKVVAEAGRKKQRESDEWDSKNFLEKADAAVGAVEKPLLKAAGKVAVAGAKAGKAYVDMQAGYLGRARRWLGGDPDARRRLAAK